MKDHIIVNGTEIEYECLKQRRKTLSVRVKEDGSVTVKAPGWVSNREIKAFVSDRANWIYDKVTLAKERSKLKKKSFGNGDICRCLGKDYLLLVESAEKDRVRESESGSIIHVWTTDVSQEHVRELLKKLWYKKLKEYANERIEAYMPVITAYSEKKGIKLRQYTGLSIKTMKSRWGSCSVKGHINLNVKLIAADTDVTDYVIVHEMCHLMYMDHSPDFWSAVEYVFADYRDMIRSLRDDGWSYDI
ncbi:MAG: M48 family metallopeptidase [Lachnospiraceae bacterium]|nr:M48 family metallopeptidase [Lachnospiraceae bacterium]